MKFVHAGRRAGSVLLVERPLEQRSRFVGIQALRCIAALLVVAAHLPPIIESRAGTPAPAIPTGQVGVAVFFTISGLVIALTTQRGSVTATGFALRRIIRIVPLAWTVLTLKVTAGAVAPHLLERFRSDWAYVLASYLFIPARGTDGLVQPLYTVMWTLSFELFFYGVVAVALALGRRPLDVAAPVMTVLACASMLRPSDWPAWAFYADPYVLLFIVGMVFGHVANRTASTGTMGWGAVAVVTWTLANVSNSAPLPTLVLLPVAVIALGSALWAERAISARIRPGLNLLGDASYALYLTHPIAAPLAVALLAAVLPPGMPWWALGAPAVAFAVTVGVLTWLWVDRPITKGLAARFRPRSEVVA